MCPTIATLSLRRPPRMGESSKRPARRWLPLASLPAAARRALHVLSEIGNDQDTTAIADGIARAIVRTAYGAARRVGTQAAARA